MSECFVLSASKKDNPFRPERLTLLPLTERGMDEPGPVMVWRQPRQIDEDIDRTRLRFEHIAQAHYCPVRHSRGARSW